jgi:dihydrolipoamide dehydrogenase
MSTKTQLVVIGAGPAGYPAAFRASDLGLQVTLVDPEKNPGGVCLYRGCIPSKALLHIARLIHEAREAGSMGLSFGEPKIDLDKIRAWKNSVVQKITGGTGLLAKSRKIPTVQGTARFQDPHTLVVEKAGGGSETISFEHAIIATGSRPARVPGLSIDSPRLLDSTSALDLPDIPPRLLVVGGGYIGLELGSVYAALGSMVTVVEMMPGLLPGADRDLVALLNKRLSKEFESILLGAKVVELKEESNGLRVRFEGPDVKEPEQRFDRVLVSVGRKSNSENLGLDKAGVAVTPRGWIQVDGQRRTSQKHIFAVGDIAGEPMLAHKGTHEAYVAVEAILGKKSVFEPRAIPAVVFTDPEIAWCGLTENEAREKGIEVKVSRFPWAASGRAVALERVDGVTKLLCDPKTGRLLGVGMAGVNAGDLISESALAMEMGATAEDLALTIHPHPTLSETVMEAAEVHTGHCTHLGRPR